MKSVLEELYYGNIYPTERSWSPSPELRKKCLEIDKAFQAKLKAADPSLVDDFVEWQDVEAKASSGADKSTFLYGFRLGAQMMLEILDQP